MDVSLYNWGVLLIVIVISIVLFLAMREVICWYFKINQRITNQGKIISLLNQLLEETKTHNKITEDK